MTARAVARTQLRHPWPSADDATRPPRPGPAIDRRAWPEHLADRAAADRWRQRHAAIVRIAAMDLAVPPVVAAEQIDAALAHGLAGIRRVDLRLPAADPLPPLLESRGWFAGSVDGDVVCSRLLDPVWRTLEPPAPPRSGPAAAVAKAVRRAKTVLAEGRVIDQVQILAAEVRGQVRSGRAASPPRAEPVDGAPAGAGPFAATRYRTIGRALALVPDSLRSTVLLDVGAGDGRVLVEARRLGFARGLGWEIDPELVAIGNERVRPWGELVPTDATATPVPADVGVVYIFNPFDPDALGRFAIHLGASIRQEPRPLLVLSVNPRAIAPLEAAGLIVVEANPDFALLATRAAGPATTRN